MRKALSAGCLAGVLAASTGAVSAWGFVAHRIVTENAVAVLPPGLAPYYADAASRLSDASIEPDTILRKRDGDLEGRRHFIDLDRLDRPPFDRIPRDEKKARARYGDRRLDRAGLLPWRVSRVREDLRDAFRAGDVARVLTLSGWLSHYVADACQPLHTTSNYDGQKTGNKGLHAAFETDMIDRRKAAYRVETAPDAPPDFRAIPDPQRLIFDVIVESNRSVAALLRADTRAMLAVKKRRADYFERMEELAGPIARDRLSRAVTLVALFWYDAWREAGRPAPPPSGRPRSGSGKGHLDDRLHFLLALQNPVDHVGQR